MTRADKRRLRKALRTPTGMPDRAEAARLRAERYHKELDALLARAEREGLLTDEAIGIAIKLRAAIRKFGGER